MDEDDVQSGRPETGEGVGASWGNELSGTVWGPSVQARSIHGGIQFNVTPRLRLPVPAQLPSPGFFANRHDELMELQQLAEPADEADPLTLVVVTGVGGVGKTTLTLRWLHQVRSEYDDGQLFVDLQGFSGGAPMSSSEPLERFLRALGVGAESVPIDPDEQAALFRSLTTGRRLIVMLDNAASAAQVRPLLPGPGPALVVVTTRRRLSGLFVEGARFLDLGPLNQSGAVELLRQMVGSDRIQAELQEVRSLVTLCGRLPLAVCASGARLAARRRWSIARVVRELADESGRLSALSMDDDVSVRAVFDLSYQALPDDTARLYRLLGLHPGADFDSATAAAMAEIDRDESARLLDILVGANLLEEGADDRFRFHDLLRLHARGKAVEAEHEQERRAAFARLVDWYLRTTVAADLVINPGRWHLGGYYEGERRVSFDGSAAALAWLELELANVMAVLKEAHQQGFHEFAWQICEAMWGLFLLRKHYRLWIESHQIGVAAARACSDQRAQARMLGALGYAYISLQDFATAIRLCQEALQTAQRAGHSLAEASALEYLGVAELKTGHNDDAIDFFGRARDIHQRLGRPRGVALMSRHIGGALSDAGRYSEAIKHLTDTLRFFADCGERYHEARSLTRLGQTYLLAGLFDDAGEALVAALPITLEIGARHEEANVHVLLAQLANRLGDPATERDHLEQALTIYTDLGAPQAEEVKSRLAGHLPG